MTGPIKGPTNGANNGNDALFAAACSVRRHAHAPYSTFAVGAALRADDGCIYAGCNVENASFPEGWCAETSAISAAVSGGAKRIEEIAIVADAALCTPCGGCRQRLAEFADDSMMVHIYRPSHWAASFRLRELIPHKFVLNRHSG